jgi:hypothetical protein
MDRWCRHSEQASYCEGLPQPVVPIIALAHAHFPSTALSMIASASTAPVLAAQYIEFAIVVKTLPIQANKTRIPLGPGAPPVLVAPATASKAANKCKKNAKKKKKNHPEDTEAVEKAAKATKKAPKKTKKKEYVPALDTPREAHKKAKRSKDVPARDTPSESPKAKKTKKAVIKKRVNRAKATVVKEDLDDEGAADCIFDHQGTVDVCIKCEDAHDLEYKLKGTKSMDCLTPYDSGNIVPSERCPVSLCDGNEKTQNQEGKRCKCSVCFTRLVKRMKREEEHRNEQAANGVKRMSHARKQSKRLGV